MFYKINKTGCNERKGLVEVRYDLYLDPEDHNYNDHYVQVPIIPEGKDYKGKLGEMGRPVDQEDWKKWFDGLEKVWQHNPFCCHFCQFEPNVTDEEILFVGELALDMAHKNWKDGDLTKNKNLPVTFSNDQAKKAISESRLKNVINQDFVAFEKTVETNYSIKE